MHGPHFHDPARRDWSARQAERAERRAERWAERHERWAERRAARAEQRASCSPGAAFRYWWLIFPLFFWGRGMTHGGWAGSGQGHGDALSAFLELTFAAPLAHVLANGMGVSFVQAWGLLALAGLVAAGTALVALRAGQPTRAL